MTTKNTTAAAGMTMTLEARIRRELRGGAVAGESLAIRLFGNLYSAEQQEEMLAVLRRIATARNMGWNTYDWRLK